MALKDPEVKSFLICQPRHLKGPARSIRSPGPTAAATPLTGISKDAKNVKNKDKKAKAKANAKRIEKLEKVASKGGGKGLQTPPPSATGETRVRVPKGLLPKCRAKGDAGTPFCFGYNLGSCSNSCQPGQRCPKGFHKCCFEGRTENHPLKGNH